MGKAGKLKAMTARQAQDNWCLGSNHECLSTLLMLSTFLNQERARLAITSVSHQQENVLPL